MTVLKNPILPGFYPDPSVCAVGGDFYLVTSTFEYFPGVPVFHSRDLVHWRQIGHCLTRPSQLNLDGVRPSQGIYAPTIRYHDGLFYMITTLVADPPYFGNVNFFVTAKDPAGPWSEPVVVRGAQGIDPTLFFDTDGTPYYLGNLRPDPKGAKLRHIWLQRVDLKTGELLGQRHILRTDGAVSGAGTPEGPHLYRVGAYYYLLIAEGGTSHHHAVSVFRSASLFGPYEGNPRNPILTHRNMRTPAPINSTGHCDLFALPDGQWWCVMLASRPDGGDYRNLGRETFAAPVIWEDQWPVISPDSGRLEFSYPAPQLPQEDFLPQAACDHFQGDALELCWNHLRTPEGDYVRMRHPGLALRLKPETLGQNANPAFIGRRQQHFCCCVRTKMTFIPQNQESAGLTLLMNSSYHLRMECVLQGQSPVLRVVRRFAGEEQVLAQVPLDAFAVELMAVIRYQRIAFYYASVPEKWQCLCRDVDGTLLCKETAGGYTGTYLGLFASSGGQHSQNEALFDWFEYQPIEAL